jgi:hypothetical protein
MHYHCDCSCSAATHHFVFYKLSPRLFLGAHANFIGAKSNSNGKKPRGAETRNATLCLQIPLAEPAEEKTTTNPARLPVPVHGNVFKWAH